MQDFAEHAKLPIGRHHARKIDHFILGRLVSRIAVESVEIGHFCDAVVETLVRVVPVVDARCNGHCAQARVNCASNAKLSPK
jgi:hypothetical protein